MKILNIFLGIIFFAVLLSCAKPVAITGGPKDEFAPKLVDAQPPIGTVNFYQKNIYIRFDEYIRLNNVNQKLIISPPILEKPSILLYGKGLKITLNPDLLMPNTTYSFNFNDAIADNNENNILNSFVYAFSTGEVIDSLSFSGKVLDAFTKKPFEDAWVMLYSDLSDTAVFSHIPRYLTKTNKEGEFLIPFVGQDSYHIYALKDVNNNYKFDLPTEGIAFIDSVYNPKAELILTNDSLNNKKSYLNTPSDIELILFVENRQSQFIKSYKRIYDNYLEIVFNSKQYERFSLNVIGDDRSIIYAENNPDTVQVWLSSRDIIAQDSLKVYVEYTDPIYPDSLRQDTLRFRKPEKLYKDTIAPVKINFGKMPYENFIIKTDNPIDSYDDSKLKLQLKQDSIFVGKYFTLRRDSINPLILIVDAEISQNSEYRIILDSSFIKNNKNYINKIDTIIIKSNSEKEFGNIKINLGGDIKSYIVQLLLSDKQIAESVSESGYVEFLYLKPGKYTIRLIEDLNNNKRWDTGDLKNKKQPEPVYYYPSEYDVKGNWIHEIDWKPKVRITEK